MLDKLAPCEAPCCVQARGGERPLGPVPQRVPVPAVQAGEDQDGEPAPALSNLGRYRRQERRRLRKEKERRIKERLMVDSDSTSEEEICQELSRMTLDKMTEPRDYYSNTAIVQRSVCGTIQMSGRIHIEYFPCDDHHDNQTDEEYDDDSDTKECDFKTEDNFKQEEIHPEFDNDTAKFEAEWSVAEHADLREDDDEEFDTRVHDAEQADGLEEDDEDVVEDVGDEDLVEEEDTFEEDHEEEGDRDQDWEPEEGEDQDQDWEPEEDDDNDDEEGYDDNNDEEGYDYDDYECDNSNDYDSCNDCDYDS